jgi:hypothetical protein
MKLESVLAKKRTAIVKKWFDLVVDTYPADTSRFLKSQKDPFANPVGNATREGLAALLDELGRGRLDPTAAAGHLDPIIRIRAVQRFTPGQATGFVFSLKQFVRDHLAEAGADRELAGELAAFDARVDQLCLIAFDIYMKCREKIYQLQATEQKDRYFKAFKRAGLVTDIGDGEPTPGDPDLTQ